MPKDMEEADLLNLFAEYGEVSYIKIGTCGLLPSKACYIFKTKMVDLLALLVVIYHDIALFNNTFRILIASVQV